MALFKTRGAAIYGIDAHLIDVEVDMFASGNARDSVMVGMPDVAVRESRERIKSALINSGFGYPNKRITINLAPANVRKEGAGFDLPVAIGMLAGNDQLMSDQLGNLVVVGKLALTGSVSILKAKLPIAKLARALEVSPRFAIFSIVSGVVCCYFLPDTIYDLERTSLTLWAPSV